MLTIKKTMALVFALSSSVVFANPASENHAGSINISALYLQPSFGGNGLGYSSFGNYAGADNQQVIRTINGTNRIYNVTPDRTLGFQIGGVYRYSCNNTVTLDWYHLSNTVNGHLPGTSLFSASIDGYYAGDLELATRWDAVNLEMGHELTFRTTETLNLHAGLGYVRIKNTFTNHPKLFLNGSPYFTSIDNLSFRGFGPRMGADYSHRFGNGLNLYLKSAGSLLMGTTRQAVTGYINVVNNIYGVIPYGTNNFVSSSTNVIVPELEAKLGLSYQYQLSRGSLGFDLGYMWMTYLKSIVAYTGIGVVGSSIGTPNSTHFDLNGAYFSVAWNM
jgi:hypothetical protein